MTLKGTKANILKTLLQVDQHQFREKKLCSSPSYQRAMEEASKEMTDYVPMSAEESNRREAQGLSIGIPGIHGFFYIAPDLGDHPLSGTGSPVGGHNEFRHASKRYKDGWDAGKEQT